MAGNVPPGGAVGQLGSRQSGERRELYEPKWSTLRITRSNESEQVFFQVKSGVKRISNIDQPGVISVHEGLTVFRMLLTPWYGTSEADYIAFARDTLIELTVQKDLAYRLLVANQADGLGFYNGSLATLGYPSPNAATDLGEVEIGPGETFEGLLRFFRPLQTGQDMLITLTLESMVDEPIT